MSFLLCGVDFTHGKVQFSRSEKPQLQEALQEEDMVRRPSIVIVVADDVRLSPRRAAAAVARNSGDMVDTSFIC